MRRKKNLKYVLVPVAAVLCIFGIGFLKKNSTEHINMIVPEDFVSENQRTHIDQDGKNTEMKTQKPEDKTPSESEKIPPTTHLQNQDIFHHTTKPNELTHPTNPNGAQSSMSSEVLKNAIENNTYGWVKVDGKYYIEDDWSSAYGVKTGEKIGHSSAIEGNLEIFGIVGEIYYLEDENYQGCLMIKSQTGRDIIFVPIP